MFWIMGLCILFVASIVQYVYEVTDNKALNLKVTLVLCVWGIVFILWGLPAALFKIVASLLWALLGGLLTYAILKIDESELR